jgi:type II secretory pathway pseudopilin PulG
MRRQSGFAYLFLLFALMVLAISALAIGSLQYYARIRSDEAELLRIGSEFRHALASYRDAHMSHAYPVSLEELLLDQRSGVDRRHLRKLYFDPVTRSQEWGLVVEQGRIVGIHSLSDRTPLKVAGFDPEDADFEGAEHYADWVFRSSAAAIPLEVGPPRSQGAAGR